MKNDAEITKLDNCRNRPKTNKTADFTLPDVLPLPSGRPVPTDFGQ